MIIFTPRFIISGRYLENIGGDTFLLVVEIHFLLVVLERQKVQTEKMPIFW